MTQETYLKELNGLLSKLPEEEKRDLVDEIEMHFMEAKKRNRTEEDIIKSLGKPKVLASNLLLEYDLNELMENGSWMDNLLMVFNIIGIGFKNMILLPIFASVGALVLSFYMVILSLYLSAGAFIIAPILKFLAPSMVTHDPLPLWTLPIIGIMVFLLNKKLHALLNKMSQALYRFLLKYLKTDFKKMTAVN